MKDFNPPPKDVRFESFFGSIASFTENNIVYKNLPKLVFEPNRLDEYRQALTAVYMRFGKTVTFLGWNHSTNEASLLKSNTIFEALIHFINNEFTWSISEVSESLFANLSRPDQRRFYDAIIHIEVLQYHGENEKNIKDFVTEILQNLKS